MGSLYGEMYEDGAERQQLESQERKETRYPDIKATWLLLEDDGSGLKLSLEHIGKRLNDCG